MVSPSSRQAETSKKSTSSFLERTRLTASPKEQTGIPSLVNLSSGSLVRFPASMTRLKLTIKASSSLPSRANSTGISSVLKCLNFTGRASPPEPRDGEHAEHREHGARDPVDPPQSAGREPGSKEARGPAQHEPPRSGADKDAEDQRQRGEGIAARVLGHSKAREYSGEGEDRRGVRERQKERRGVGTREPASRGRGCPLGRAGQERPRAEEDEKSAADQAQPSRFFHQEIRDEGKPESGDGAVSGIRRGCPEAGDEARGASLRQRTPDAEHPDRPDGSGDRKPDNYAFQKETHAHQLPLYPTARAGAETCVRSENAQARLLERRARYGRCRNWKRGAGTVPAGNALPANERSAGSGSKRLLTGSLYR